MKTLTLILFVLVASSSQAVTIKLATLVPKGTNWAKTISDMSKEIKEKTDGKVKVKVFYGGVQGDEPDVLRKTRIGQVHGGIFTGKTLGDINSDIRAIELPFNFYHDHQKAMKAISSLREYYDNKLLTKGFVSLGFYGIGKVYVVSTKKVTNLSELQGVKMWAWEGDFLIRTMMESLGLVTVPLALPDVMSSLSTGIIEAAYGPPLAILALQWQNKIKYIIDFPTAYSLGALLVTKKQWKKIPKNYQQSVKDIAQKYVDKANKMSVKDNEQALKTLKDLGVELVEFSKEDLKKAEKIREDVIGKLKGKLLSESIINKIEKLR